MQGESLSPLLYSFYVNDMEIELINSGCQSYEFTSLNLFLLMYADDTVLLAVSTDDLQKNLNIFNIYCEAWKLSINCSKSKVAIFRKRNEKSTSVHFKR